MQARARDGETMTPDSPQPDVTATVHAAETPQARSVSLIVIATILVFGALYIARDFFIPVALAVLLSLVLSPIVRWLARWHVPYPAAAALVLGLVVAAVGGPATGSQGPSGRGSRRRRCTPQGRAQASRGGPPGGTGEPGRDAGRAGTTGAATSTPHDVVVAGPSLGSRLAGTSAAVLGGILEVLLLLYALLAVGDLFLQKLVGMLPRRGDREKAVSIARVTEGSISGYLALTALINICEGAVVSAAMAMVGMPTPLVWGVLVAVVEFVPYVGMLSMLVMLTVAALTTFDTVPHALVVPAIYLAINFVQGNVVTPLVMSRRLTLNPVAIFVSLALWWWLWGLPGRSSRCPCSRRSRSCATTSNRSPASVRFSATGKRPSGGAPSGLGCRDHGASAVGVGRGHRRGAAGGARLARITDRADHRPMWAWVGRRAAAGHAPRHYV